MVARRLLFILFLSVAVAEPSLLHGCDSIRFASDGFCGVDDVELLPGIHLEEPGVVENVDSPTACQSICQLFHECKYFTYRVNHVLHTSECFLKPDPSDSAAAAMVALHHSPSEMQFISGPKTCGQKCVDGSPLAPDCGASSPGACSFLGNFVFDSQCPRAGDCPHHTVYPCCRDCQASRDPCCGSRVYGQVLVGGLDSEASRFAGTRSPDECQALCFLTSGCTHWNFVGSPSTEFIGGACYVKHYAERPQIQEAPAGLLAVMGTPECRSADPSRPPPAIKTSTTTTTSVPSVPFGVPIPGTCYESGIDVVHGTLFDKWGVENSAACQTLCQQWQGCSNFVFRTKETRCQLKYTAEGRERVDEELVWGPRDCPEATPTVISDVCVNADMDINLENLNELPANHAADCGTKCKWFRECQGWSYLKERCYLKPAAEPLAPKAGVLSGTKDCRWVGYGDRRLAEQELTCAIGDAEYVGADIEVLFNVENVEACHLRCLRRGDCKTATFSQNDLSCKISWGGSLTKERPGFVAVSRDCGCSGSQCPVAASDGFEVRLVNGLAEHSLGGLASWAGNDLRQWQGLVVRLLKNSGNGNCFLSDDVLPEEESCWDERESYFPVTVRVQVIGLAPGEEFVGFSDEKQKLDEFLSGGYFEILNEEIKFDESSRGIHKQPATWPSELMEQMNLSEGQIYLRAQSLFSATPQSFKLQICIVYSEDPVERVCAKPVAVPPFDA